MARRSLRAKIIASGVTTLRRRGYAASGIRDIAAAAGVPPGSSTNHLRSGEASGIAVLDLYYEQTEAIFETTLRDATRPPVERLRAYFEAITDFLAEIRWRHGCMSLERAEHSEPLRERPGEIFQGLTRGSAEAVGAAQAAGEVRDDLDAADVADLLPAWNGAMLRMKVDSSPAPLERFKRVLLSTLLAAAPGPAREAATGARARR